MRLSKMHLKTLREVPNEAEIPSHILLLRSGMIKKTVAGIYSYMPMGWRTVRKIEDIVREEMDAKGAQELQAQCCSLRSCGRKAADGTHTVLKCGELRTETAEISASDLQQRKCLQT